MTDRPWFKRKTYGWGWTPVSWQGWLVTLGLVVVITVIVRLGAFILVHGR